VNRLKLTDKQKRKNFKAVFKLLDRKLQIQYTEIARILDLDSRIASSRLKEALNTH
jgi:hypothetical protein